MNREELEKELKELEKQGVKKNGVVDWILNGDDEISFKFFRCKAKLEGYDLGRKESQWEYAKALNEGIDIGKKQVLEEVEKKIMKIDFPEECNCENCQDARHRFKLIKDNANSDLKEVENA